MESFMIHIWNFLHNFVNRKPVKLSLCLTTFFYGLQAFPWTWRFLCLQVVMEVFFNSSSSRGVHLVQKNCFWGLRLQLTWSRPSLSSVSSSDRPLILSSFASSTGSVHRAVAKLCVSSRRSAISSGGSLLPPVIISKQITKFIQSLQQLHMTQHFKSLRPGGIHQYS